MMTINENKLNDLWTLTKYVYGIVPFIIGADKFFYCIVDWNIYISPFVAATIPPMYLIPILGIVEMMTGIAILTIYPRIGSYMVAGLICVIIINLLMIGDYYDIILRDLVVVYNYILFAILTQIKERRSLYQQ